MTNPLFFISTRFRISFGEFSEKGKDRAAICYYASIDTLSQMYVASRDDARHLCFTRMHQAIFMIIFW
jgi:hypothetical protein